jgi:hypothetical protein
MRVRTGSNPWVGCEQYFKFPNMVIEKLDSGVFLVLNHVAYTEMSTI